MAQYEHKPGSFSLFKNTYKQDGDNKPDYKGKGKDLQGNEIDVAAWLRDGKDGAARWLSCTFKVKEAREQDHRVPPDPAPSQASPERQRAEQEIRDMPDDNPF